MFKRYFLLMFFVLSGSSVFATDNNEDNITTPKNSDVQPLVNNSGVGSDSNKTIVVNQFADVNEEQDTEQVTKQDTQQDIQHNTQQGTQGPSIFDNSNVEFGKNDDLNPRSHPNSGQVVNDFNSVNGSDAPDQEDVELPTPGNSNKYDVSTENPLLSCISKVNLYDANSYKQSIVFSLIGVTTQVTNFKYGPKERLFMIDTNLSLFDEEGVYTKAKWYGKLGRLIIVAPCSVVDYVINSPAVTLEWLGAKKAGKFFNIPYLKDASMHFLAGNHGKGVAEINFLAVFMFSVLNFFGMAGKCINNRVHFKTAAKIMGVWLVQFGLISLEAWGLNKLFVHYNKEAWGSFVTFGVVVFSMILTQHFFKKYAKSSVERSYNLRIREAEIKEHVTFFKVFKRIITRYKEDIKNVSRYTQLYVKYPKFFRFFKRFSTSIKVVSSILVVGAIILLNGWRTKSYIFKG